MTARHAHQLACGAARRESGSSPSTKLGCPLVQSSAARQARLRGARHPRLRGARHARARGARLLAWMTIPGRCSPSFFTARRVLHGRCSLKETEPVARPCPPALLAIIILRCPPSPLEEGDAHERRKPPRQLAAMEGRLPAGGRAHRSRHALPPVRCSPIALKGNPDARRLWLQCSSKPWEGAAQQASLQCSPSFRYARAAMHGLHA
ncbi:hypothetical protein Dimus_038642 [Dionaea muscipula]